MTLNNDLRALAAAAAQPTDSRTRYRQTHAALRNAATPDVILELLGELDRLRAIVNDLAASDPVYTTNNYDYDCALCCEHSLEDVEHLASCVWRRAVEYKES